MIRRLVALTVACLVLGLPVASAICEATCAAYPSHSNHSAASHDRSNGTHAVHHHESVSITNQVVSIAPLPHVCDRLDGVATEARAIARLAAPTAVVAAPAVALVVLTHRLPADVNHAHGPTAPDESTSPLRI